MKNKYIYFFLALITASVYSPILWNEFISLDDPTYIIINDDIINNNLKNLLTKNYIGNYHPITMLFFWFEYKLFGLNSSGFHFISIILHVINSILIFKLLNQIVKKPTVAFLVSILFALHPATSESVAWVSEQKDLLYVLFGLITVLLYQSEYKYRIIAIIIFFSLSLLSKGQAVAIPIILLIIEVVINKKAFIITLKNLLPLFIMAFIFGLITLSAQEVDKMENLIYARYDSTDKIIYILYAIFLHIKNFFFFNHLNITIDFPLLDGKHIYPAYILDGFLILFIPILFLFKKFRTNKIFIAGVLIFLVCLIFTPPFVFVGKVLTSNRYTYLAYFGFYIVIAHLLCRLNQIKHQLFLVIPVIGIFIFFLIPRLKEWQTTDTLFYNDSKKFQDNYTSLDILTKFLIRVDDNLEKTILTRSEIKEVPKETIKRLYPKIQTYNWTPEIHLKPLLFAVYHVVSLDQKEFSLLTDYEKEEYFQFLLKNIYELDTKTQSVVYITYSAYKNVSGDTTTSYEYSELYLKIPLNNRISSNDYLAFDILGQKAYKNNDLKKAESYFYKSAENNPNHINAQYNLITTLLKSNQKKKALDLFNKRHAILNNERYNSLKIYL